MNHGASRTFSLRLEHDISPANRVGAIVRHGGAHFLVPNERIQQEAGQRQDRSTRERAAQFSWQRMLSQKSVIDVRAMGRSGSAALW